MIRNIAVAGVIATMMGCLPAFAQETSPELDGAPGSQAARQAEIQKQVDQMLAQKQAAADKLKADKLKADQAKLAKQTEAQKQAAADQQAKLAKQTEAQKQAQAAADKLKADQARLAKQAEAQKAEQARLAQQIEDLKAQQAELDARAAELDEQEKRIADLRGDQSAHAADLAELERIRQDASRKQHPDESPDVSPDVSNEPTQQADNEDAGEPPSSDVSAPRRPLYARLDFDAAERSCAQAGRDEAFDRNFHSARYEGEPRVYQGRGWELRGRMRLEDRRGYLLVDTVCEVGADGEARRFVFLR